ncbi:MAG: hypothetical protein K0S41_350 [Anaerocolumna sp.]|jgi:predicted membrane protein|nr:hypothetical protein [Anaerocolumna sp.]
MKNTVARATWGSIFVLLGLFFAGKAFGIIEFNIFFSGWWTLFIIIPCIIGLSEKRNRSASLIGLGVGILLLLSAQGIFHWYMFSRLFIALLFIVLGYSIITRGSRKDYNKYQNSDSSNSNSNNYNTNNNDTNSYNTNNYNTNDNDTNSYNTNNYNTNNNETNNYNTNNNSTDNNDTNNYNSNNYYSGNYHTSAGSTNHGGNNHFSSILGGRNVQYSDEVFTGAVISSILGNMQLDLRKAIFNGDAVIDTTCILGGIDIFVPANVRVMVNCTPILGGVDNKAIPPYDNGTGSYTVFINGTCILGGVVVK